MSRAPKCPGCGAELHKSCPAYGTDAYLNRKHPAWGNPLAIDILSRAVRATQRLRGVLKFHRSALCLLLERQTHEGTCRVSQQDLEKGVKLLDQALDQPDML